MSKHSILLQVLALVGFRMLMDYPPLNMLFSQKDLYWLDSLMPGAKKKAKEHLRKKQRKRSKFLSCGCCRSRRGRQVDEELNADKDMAPMKPDIVLKIEEDLEKKQNQVDSRIKKSGQKDRLENEVSVLQPLLDNGIMSEGEPQQLTTRKSAITEISPITKQSTDG